MSTLEQRIERLEAESQIRQLIARYCFYLDHREIDRLGELFTVDATIRSADGVMNAIGPDTITEMFRRRFDVLGPGSHYMHDIQIDFDGEARATGRVSGHAELMRSGSMFVTAMRYGDSYARTDDGWKFSSRLISFLYYVPVGAYAGILARSDRNWAYGEPAPADFPERLPTWTAYESMPGA